MPEANAHEHLPSDAPADEVLPSPPRRTSWLLHPLLYAVLLLALVGVEFGSRHWQWPRPVVARQKKRPSAPRKTLGERWAELRRRGLQRPKSVASAVVILVPLLAGSTLLLGYLILRACNIRVFPPHDFRVATWDAWHLARLAVVYLVLPRLAMGAIGWLQAAYRITPDTVGGAQNMFIVLGINAAVFVALSLFVLALVRAGGERPLRALGLQERRVPGRAAIGVTSIVMLFPLIIAALVLTFVFGPLVGIYEEQQELLQVACQGSAAVFAALVVTGVLIAPITEEILFRGFLYTTLRRYFGPLAAITVSAVAFSLVHGFAFGFLRLFLIGFLLAYLYERTGSLVASITAHAANNLYSFFVVWMVYR